MSDEANPKAGAGPMDIGTRLAFERTYLAHENTQMAWVRTALSLISFGFAIAKFFEYLHQRQGDSAPFLGGRDVGIVMIAMGLVALVLGTLQHRRAIKMLREQCPSLPRSLAGIGAGLLALLGILALVGAFVRQ